MPNCHAMLHLGRRIRTIDELKRLMSEVRSPFRQNERHNMAIPKYDEMMLPLLHLLADGKDITNAISRQGSPIIST